MRNVSQVSGRELYMGSRDILLYKYYPYSEYLLEMLLLKKAWYSKPEVFNDPLDCYLNFNDCIPVNKYENCLRWQLKREGRTESQIKKDLELLISPSGEINDDAKRIIEGISASTLNVIRNIGVLCLTERNDSVTMWAHYADNHKGVCVGFVVTDEASPIQVTYVSNAPLVNFSDLLDSETENDEYRWIFSKNNDWSYEREWRLVVHQGNQLWPIPGKISHLIFGLRMDQSKRRTIIKILENESDIRYSEVIRNPDLLQVRIKDL